jgi:hypothetical protein
MLQSTGIGYEAIAGKTRIMDHDRLFKELLTTFFVEFIELFFPELAAYLDRDSAEFLDKEIFTDVTHGERHEADIVAKARFRGKDLGFLIHVEPQARRETVFSRRMFTYFARLHEKYDMPIYPIALFSYPAPLKPEPSEYRVEFPDLTVLTFNFRVVQLNRLAWRDFLDRTNPIAAALMTNMAMAPGEQPRVKLACLRMLARLQLDPARERLISGFIDQYLQLTIDQNKVFEAEIEQLVPQEKEGVMELVTSWMQEGIAKGLLQGREQGEREMVMRQLRKRFGTLDAAIVSRIESLNKDDIEQLGEELLSFTGHGDLDRWLQLHSA